MKDGDLETERVEPPHDVRAGECGAAENQDAQGGYQLSVVSYQFTVYSCQLSVPETAPRGW
jgi:hypothetical protein